MIRWPGRIVPGMRRLFVPAGLVALALAAATVAQDGAPAGPAVTKAADVRPTTRDTNCLAGGCHAKQKEFKFLHGPVAIGACEMCHVYDDVAKHTFKDKRVKQRMCDFCHIGRAEGEYVHKPVAQGDCLGCHNPHGAPTRELLRKENMGEMCASCHDKVTRGMTYLHGPVATGACGGCHKSHASDHPKLLIAEGRKLCLDCHKEMGREIDGVKYVHKPVKEDCRKCHETHASNYRNHLTMDPLTLCVSCHEHEKIKTLAATATYKHSVVTEGKACVNCHTAHGGDLANLMRGEPLQICLTCHDETIRDEKGEVLVASIADLASPNLFKHGPVRDGTCGTCHDVHGGSLPDLVVAPYPETFYESFDVDKYALCFKCHTDQLVLQKTTTTVTGFRNGATNLHYQHTNSTVRGRSCHACHNTHASKNPMHVAESVPYGNWKLPINLTVTPTGGTCASGCHQKLSYDRVNPVKRDTLPSLTPGGGDAKTVSTPAPPPPAPKKKETTP